MRGIYYAGESRHVAIPLSLSFLCFFLVSGCTPRYVYAPTIAQRALDDNIRMEEITDKIPKKRGFNLTDVDVFAFTNDVKQAWRNRSQLSRTAGVLTGVSRVGLAGAATTVAATSPAGSASDAVPILTGIATFIGEIFGLVDAGGRSEAYQDGLRLILEAEAEYVATLPISADQQPNVSGTRLTDAGKQLLIRVNAAIAVVDKALQNRVPTQKEIEAATANVEKVMVALRAKIEEEEIERAAEEQKKREEAKKKREEARKKKEEAEQKDSKESQGDAGKTSAGGQPSPAKPPAQ
ncbi:MAG: hypothetical protein ACREQP_16885 [Candidatus Binatia bacterium]